MTSDGFSDVLKGVVGTLAVVLLAVSFFLSMLAYNAGTHHWSMTQRDFPCAEDEVLGYNPRSHDHVVCFSIENGAAQYGPAR